MKLSIVIPAYNEAQNLPNTIDKIYSELSRENIEHEILVSNDNSTDNTLSILVQLESKYPTLRHVTNEKPNGYGYAVRKGLENFQGDCVVVTMADLSDDSKEALKGKRGEDIVNADVASQGYEATKAETDRDIEIK